MPNTTPTSASASGKPKKRRWSSSASKGGLMELFSTSPAKTKRKRPRDNDVDNDNDRKLMSSSVTPVKSNKRKNVENGNGDIDADYPARPRTLWTEKQASSSDEEEFNFKLTKKYSKKISKQKRKQAESADNKTLDEQEDDDDESDDLSIRKHANNGKAPRVAPRKKAPRPPKRTREQQQEYPLFVPDGTGQPVAATNRWYVLQMAEACARVMTTSRLRTTTTALPQAVQPHLQTILQRFRHTLRNSAVPTEVYPPNIGATRTCKKSAADPWGDALGAANRRRRQQIAQASRALTELRLQRTQLTEQLDQVVAEAERKEAQQEAALLPAPPPSESDDPLLRLHPELAEYRREEEEEAPGVSSRKFRPPPPGTMKTFLEQLRSLPG